MKKLYISLYLVFLFAAPMNNAMINMARRNYTTGKNNKTNHRNLVYKPLDTQWRPAEKPLTIAQMKNILPFLPIDRKRQNMIKSQIDRTKSLTTYKEESELRLQKIFRLPWGVTRQSTIDLRTASHAFNKKIFGMTAAKENILDMLALRKVNPAGLGETLCFVGSPGTGKTALAEIIADTLQLSYGHVALAGAHDDRAIRGSHGVYKEASEGEIAKILISCGISNPVIILDEIDKVSNRESSSSGSLQSALLQLLDPTQNNNFFDDYLGIPIDISKATFIATANYLENLSAPLKNRLHIIHVPNYTVEEKIKIAQDFLLPKLNEKTGLKELKIPVSLTHEIISHMITHYTPQESGVRQLEKMIKVLCAKQARAFLTNGTTIAFCQENLGQYLVPTQDTDFKKLIW